MIIVVDYNLMSTFANIATDDNNKPLNALQQVEGYDDYNLCIWKYEDSFLGKIYKIDIEIGEIHAYHFRNRQILMKKIREIIATIYPDEQWPALKTEKGWGTCSDRIFPIKCPHGKTHLLGDGKNYPTYIGDRHCRANSCGHFKGITKDEKIVHCSGSGSETSNN